MAEEIVKPMRDLLREIEWRGAIGCACPLCNRPQIVGHDTDCRLAAVLKET
jgi:hypothetical protein